MHLFVGLSVDLTCNFAKYIVILKNVLMFVLLSYLPFKKQKSVLNRNELIGCSYVEQCIMSSRFLCSVTKNCSVPFAAKESCAIQYK